MESFDARDSSGADQTELHQMKKGSRDSRGPVFTPHIGDIVIFQPKKKYNMQKFGHVTKLYKHNLTFVPRDGNQ